VDDLAIVNRNPEEVAREWMAVPEDEWERIEERVRRTVQIRDDFVLIPFPRIAAASGQQIARAVESYKREAAVVDARLSREVTLQVKGMALSDVCEALRTQTGIQLAAGRSVADEKVTIFCEKLTLRQVMRHVNRLFGFTWLRSGKAGEFRYELAQDLKSQLLEEELRNRDLNASLLALDAQMQKYRPYLDMSFEELKKRAAQAGDSASLLSDLAGNYGWGAVQLYHRLTPRDRTALMAGQKLIFRPEAADPDRRLPAEWTRPLLLSMGGPARVEDRLVPVAEIPGIQFEQIQLRVDRSELGQVSLSVWLSAVPQDQRRFGLRHEAFNGGLVTARSPSAAKPDNASANAALRGRPPFDQVVSLHPKPSCPAEGKFHPDTFSGNFDRVLPLVEPHVFSADVWEAVHRATGLPIVADYYTHLYPAGKVTVERRSLFEALDKAGDALGSRWRKEGGFLVCRSTSYFWDRLKEVPTRYLQRWARDRDANGSLPFADFLEMAGMPDQQLDAEAVSQGIEHYWGLREWAWLRDPRSRYQARCLALLTQEQLRRAQEPGGFPFKELTPAQQQGIMRLQYEEEAALERQGSPLASIRVEDFARTVITANYIPAGWHIALVPPESVQERPWTGPMDVVGGRTAAEATAAARRLYPRSAPQEVRQVRDGYFGGGI
jgi:hypothetical protein